MELLTSLRSPELGVALQDLAAVLLPVAGTLLGLVYAGLIFWFQGALQGLEFTRDLIEDLVAPHGKVLLDLLVGVGLVSLFSYFSLFGLASVMFWLFALLLTKDLLQFVAARGYLTTLFPQNSFQNNMAPYEALSENLETPVSLVGLFRYCYCW